MKPKPEIVLSYPFRYAWQSRGDIRMLAQQGHSWYFDRFSGINSAEDAERILPDLDGHFAVVKETDQFLFAAVDRVRSFPLFYKQVPVALHITDNIQLAESNFTWSESSARSFELGYYTEDRDTLLKDWKQLMPGEYLYYDKQAGEISTRRYHTFGNKWPQISLQPQLLLDLYLEVFRKLAEEADGCPIIVPLSGGYDSRCIVSCLKLIGAKNIFCYTYGRQDSFERKIAEKVVKKLKLNWHFTTYDPELLDIFFTDAWQAYSDKNHHFTSLPHEQDFFALYDMRQKGILPPDGIVLPGFLGDYYAGSMFKENFHKKEEPGMGHFQDWYITNRGCKFIVNAVRVYEYFGLEWRIPFASKPIMDHWLSVSLQTRCFQNGYNDAMSDIFFKPLGIDIRKPGHNYGENLVREWLKGIAPELMLRAIREFKVDWPGQDPNNTAYLRNRIFLELSEDIKNVKTDFNGVHARYFLKGLYQKFTNLGNNT